MEEQMDINDMTEENDNEGEIASGAANGNASRMALRERPRKDSISRKLRDRPEELRFLNDFDPENSERERRKSKRSQNSFKSAPYDEYGNLRHNGEDLCDCTSADCPGCWFDCEKCGSNKCGTHCRVNRKFYYESLRFDGKDSTITNPNMPLK